jgi:hypothetical protein
MSDREEMIEYLTSDYGMAQQEAELVMQDDDLWALTPTMRFTLEDKEAVEQWRDAARFAQNLGEMVINDGLLNKV